jgi:hypothetical protein
MSSKPLKIKCAGGAAAQTLALMNAIYVTQNSKREFIFEYYPYGTGSFWNFEIANVLKPDELGNTGKLSTGHSLDDTPTKPGVIVKSHPINSRGFSLEKIYWFIRKLRIDSLFLSFRHEVPINGSMKRLSHVRESTLIMSGGFVPLHDERVFESLDKRFKAGGLISPFGTTELNQVDYSVVIHYRIGDKRAKFTNRGTVGDDGILDPKVIRNLVEKLNLLDSPILVLSDEPALAQKLLSGVGLAVEVQQKRESIWFDINTMAKAKLFIGTWSQVSQLASVCVVNRGGVAYLPSNLTGKNSVKWKVEGINFYIPQFLDSTHEIYFKN